MKSILPILFLLVGAALAFPHAVIQESMYYAPYACLLGLTIPVLLNSPIRRSLTGAGMLMIVAVLLYFGGVAMSLLSGSAEGAVRSPAFYHLCVPVPFFILGYLLIGPKRDLLGWYLAGNAILSVALAIWVTQQTVKVQFYDVVQDIWVWTGNRAWVHPMTNEVIRATGLNVACFAACIGIMLVLGVRSWINKILLVTGGVGLGYIAAISETRGVIMAMFLGLWVLIFRMWKLKLIWTIIIGLTTGTVLVAGILLLGYYSDRFGYQYQVEEGFTGRAEVWAERLQRIVTEPQGHGPNYVNRGEASCHNQYIEVAFQYGVLSGFAYLAMTAVGLIGAYKILRSKSADSFDIGIASAVIATAAHGLTDSQMVSAPITFWHNFMLFGAVVGRLAALESSQAPVARPVVTARARGPIAATNGKSPLPV